MSAVNENTHTRGRAGEATAAAFFLEKGFEILQRNFRFGRYGEIDLIALKEDLLLFIEVKKRSTDRFGGAIYSISSKKADSLKKTARFFLAKNPQFSSSDTLCRFDLLAIDNGEIQWHQDIIR